MTTTEDDELVSVALGDGSDSAGGGIGTEVSEPPGSDDDSGGSFLTDPGTLAAAAGVAAAAGLGLSGLGSKILGGLLRFLGGTGVGMFLLGLFRRDKRPGPPIDFTMTTDGPLAHLTWSAPTTGGPPDKYVLEARRDGKWQEMLDFDTESTRAAVPASEVRGTETWRLRGANDHGIGKPSDEVGVAEVARDSGPAGQTTAEEPGSDEDETT